MHLLVTGAQGQLGHELRRLINTGSAEIGPIPACYAGAEVDYIDLPDLDISNYAAAKAWFGAHEPYDLVINCAAYTNVDGCEQHAELAYAANALGPMNLARLSAEQDARLVHVSTDYVFPGTESAPRKESDVPAPLSTYGRTKLAGEALVLSNNPQSFVVRTAWLYGYVGKNFVKTMLSLGERLPEVTVVNDQLGNPTSANDLAYEILSLAQSEEYGIYHCTNEGTCSWADFAQAIMEGAGLSCTVKRCSSEEYAAANPESARRPAFSSLENDRLTHTIGNAMRSWQEALATYLARYKELEG